MLRVEKTILRRIKEAVQPRFELNDELIYNGNDEEVGRYEQRGEHFYFYFEESNESDMFTMKLNQELDGDYEEQIHIYLE
jgi:hypothetical protein